MIPSFGALVEGWVLVVPKEHCISLGALRAKLRGRHEVEERNRAVLRQRYEKPVVAFEHGPSAGNHGTGCGVDHAHLHLVPLACDLLPFVEPFVPASLEWRSCDWEDLEQAYAQGLDYLYLRPDGGTALMAVCQDSVVKSSERRSLPIYVWIASSVGGNFHKWRESRKRSGR